MDRGLIGRKFRESSDRVSLIELIQSDEWIELKDKNNGLKRGDLRRAICCVTQDVHQKTMPNTWTFCAWSIEILSGLGNVHLGSSGQDLKKERKKGTVNISELVPPYLARNNQPLGLMHSSALSQWKPVADHKFVKFGPLVPFLACCKSKACFKI